MRLHNRQIKASFWTDTELIQALPPTGRLFYIGLFMLADDSGCLEDDLLAMKILLFPGDDGLHVSELSDYRKTLVSLGKLTPYLQDGKTCLFLRNFHKHQRIKTPSPPTVPLPPWIQWEPFESNPRTGKYVVNWDSYHEHTCKTEASYEGLTAGLQSSSNLNQEPRTLIVCQSDSTDGRWKEIEGAYMAVTGGTISGDVHRILQEYCDELGPDLVIKALIETKARNKKHFAYTKSILERWKNRGIRSIEDWIRNEAEFYSKVKQKQVARSTREPPPEPTGRYIPDAEETRKYLESIWGKDDGS